MYFLIVPKPKNLFFKRNIFNVKNITIILIITRVLSLFIYCSETSENRRHVDIFLKLINNEILLKLELPKEHERKTLKSFKDEIKIIKRNISCNEKHLDALFQSRNNSDRLGRRKTAYTEEEPLMTAEEIMEKEKKVKAVLEKAKKNFIKLELIRKKYILRISVTNFFEKMNPILNTEASSADLRKALIFDMQLSNEELKKYVKIFALSGIDSLLKSKDSQIIDEEPNFEKNDQKIADILLESFESSVQTMKEQIDKDFQTVQTSNSKNKNHENIRNLTALIIHTLKKNAEPQNESTYSEKSLRGAINHLIVNETVTEGKNVFNKGNTKKLTKDNLEKTLADDIKEKIFLAVFVVIKDLEMEYNAITKDTKTKNGKNESKDIRIKNEKYKLIMAKEEKIKKAIEVTINEHLNQANQISEDGFKKLRDFISALQSVIIEKRAFFENLKDNGDLEDELSQFHKKRHLSEESTSK